jgi:NADP-dependent 3-hydroxy acid dehydrogenase YdfG
MKLDVTDQKQIDRVVRDITAADTGLFGVVNSAGVAVPPGVKRCEF